MGVSLLYRQSVSEVIKSQAGELLTVISDSMADLRLLDFCLEYLQVYSGGSWIDKLIKGYSLLIASTPVFWLALLLLLVFSVGLKIFPVGLSVPIGVEAAGRRYLAGSSVSCRTACNHTQHYGCCKYCNAYQRKNDRCHGE